MPVSSVWAVLILCTVCPLIGGLPVIDWIVRGLARVRLSELGTGNISVSAAFYHGGTAIGLLAVLSEALKGVGAVLLARWLFPNLPSWEVIALLALVLGRYGMAGGAGTTNVVWGYVVHNWLGALIIFGVSGIGFAIGRNRRLARYGVLLLVPIGEAIRYPERPAAIAATVALSLLIAWIYRQIPDDLAVASAPSKSGSRKMFGYLRGQDAMQSLDDKPDSQQMGQKAATLAQLRQWGYSVPAGWVLPIGTHAAALTAHLEAAESAPWTVVWIVRSSALDEDIGDVSAAGQYQSIANVTTPAELEAAIAQCRAAYARESATQYRRDRGLVDQAGIPLLVQRQVQGQYSGVAFSRDPVDQGDRVLIEALAGGAERVVSGQVTPQQFRIDVDPDDLAQLSPSAIAQVKFDAAHASAEPEQVPSAVVQQVAILARHLELRYHGIPQDIEWTFDGERLWLLQARPITTLTPIWTRKIAAEVIPGVICPLTWSINRPLTCGVWGKIFTIVLGDRAQGLDFGETATLHYSRAYFNATLLGQIFRRMGLPAESLEFLTLGAKFSKPPVLSTLRNLPGLVRLLKREWTLASDFSRDHRQHFAPAFTHLHQYDPANLSAADLVERIEQILNQLERATYYSIFAPLSFALRQTVFKVPDDALDQRQLPEVASLQEIKALAQVARQQLPRVVDSIHQGDRSRQKDGAGQSVLLAALDRDPAGQTLLSALHQIVERYGYLSEVGTDIAVPTWHEDPQPVRDMFAQFCLHPPTSSTDNPFPNNAPAGWRQRQVQHRLNLKGQVAQVYLTLLAELRWSLIALEQRAIAHDLLAQSGDAFFLTYAELQQWAANPDQMLATGLRSRVAERRSRFEQDGQLSSVPFIVYGDDPPPDPTIGISASPPKSGVWQGIGASAGQVQGPAKVLTTLQASTQISPDEIVVVPYTDAGWAPILARAAGLVADVGGRLSHGAIVAREYGIPAVMNVENATRQFQDGQVIRIDGRAGTVEIVE